MTVDCQECYHADKLLERVIIALGTVEPTTLWEGCYSPRAPHPSSRIRPSINRHNPAQRPMGVAQSIRGPTDGVEICCIDRPENWSIRHLGQRQILNWLFTQSMWRQNDGDMRGICFVIWAVHFPSLVRSLDCHLSKEPLVEIWASWSLHFLQHCLALSCSRIRSWARMLRQRKELAMKRLRIRRRRIGYRPRLCRTTLLLKGEFCHFLNSPGCLNLFQCMNLCNWCCEMGFVGCDFH